MFVTTSFYSIRERLANLIFPEGLEIRNNAVRSANIDALTGLANKRALQLALPTAERDEDIAVVVFDANNFGKVNKHLGHSVGDVLIQQIASCLQDASASCGYAERVFRFGGDEFAILLPKEYAEKVRNAAETLFGVKTLYNVSISGEIGTTFDDADSKLQARKAMQKASVYV